MLHNKVKILSIFGTRPEAIKMAPVINRLKTLKSTIDTIVCITAQHRKMIDQVLRVFDIISNYDLNIMRPNQDLFDITTDTMLGLRDVLNKEEPDMVLVQGDTTTALAAGLSAYYFKIPVGHIEAGLRTYNKYSPFPEEKNRHLLSILSDFHFAPTAWAKSNLLKEGIPSDQVWVTGNTVIDALYSVADRVDENSVFWFDYFRHKYNLTLSDNLYRQKLILITGHRRESFGEGLENICVSLKKISQLRNDIVIVYPVHLNPNVQRPVISILQGQKNIYLIDPLEYEPFVFLMKRAYFIMTDSGGIQEEAPSLDKPVLVMRDTTERPEGIEAGVVKLIGTDKQRIINNVFELLDNEHLYIKMSKSINPYGDGKAAEKIINILLDVLVKK